MWSRRRRARRGTGAAAAGGVFPVGGSPVGGQVHPARAARALWAAGAAAIAVLASGSSSLPRAGAWAAGRAGGLLLPRARLGAVPASAEPVLRPDDQVRVRRGGRFAAWPRAGRRGRRGRDTDARLLAADHLGQQLQTARSTTRSCTTGRQPTAAEQADHRWSGTGSDWTRPGLPARAPSPGPASAGDREGGRPRVTRLAIPGRVPHPAGRLPGGQRPDQAESHHLVGQPDPAVRALRRSAASGTAAAGAASRRLRSRPGRPRSRGRWPGRRMPPPTAPAGTARRRRRPRAWSAPGMADRRGWPRAAPPRLQAADLAALRSEGEHIAVLQQPLGHDLAVDPGAVAR